ncbi:MAG: 50S ribosomal protein L19 [Gammaproteobacteria bacterium]|jgi:large subunit ribosomal protein L19|nr:50S ribosomal protein L19 [Gammaproteobacteria bacterium]
MSSLIEKIESKQIEKNNAPEFRTGDTLVVWVKVREGDRERLQAFEGVVIKKRNRGLRSAFTLQKHSYGVCVLRTFQVNNPNIKIEVKRPGKVRQSRIYHYIGLVGKKARIKERLKKKA